MSVITILSRPVCTILKDNSRIFTVLEFENGEVSVDTHHNTEPSTSPLRVFSNYTEFISAYPEIARVLNGHPNKLKPKKFPREFN